MRNVGLLHLRFCCCFNFALSASSRSSSCSCRTLFCNLVFQSGWPLKKSQTSPEPMSRLRLSRSASGLLGSRSSERMPSMQARATRSFRCRFVSRGVFRDSTFFFTKSLRLLTPHFFGFFSRVRPFRISSRVVASSPHQIIDCSCLNSFSQSVICKPTVLTIQAGLALIPRSTHPSVALTGPCAMVFLVGDFLLLCRCQLFLHRVTC
jgi:hypothetical protein